MKFGNRLQQRVLQPLPSWEGKYSCYKGLKKAPNLLPISEADFVCLLDNKNDKFNAFFMENEEDFIIRHQDFHRRILSGISHLSDKRSIEYKYNK